jgi:hypothetical protein
MSPDEDARTTLPGFEDQQSACSAPLGSWGEFGGAPADVIERLDAVVCLCGGEASQI